MHRGSGIWERKVLSKPAEHENHMRVELRLGAGHPELIADLQSIPSRQRSARVQFLAQLGLLMLQGRWSDVGGSGLLRSVPPRQSDGMPSALETASATAVPPENPEVITRKPLSAARKKALSQLGQSFGSEATKTD